MILQKLEMNNFRQYIGEQTVEFSTVFFATKIT